MTSAESSREYKVHEKPEMSVVVSGRKSSTIEVLGSLLKRCLSHVKHCITFVRITSRLCSLMVPYLIPCRRLSATMPALVIDV